jgi:phospholipase/carboxylesterase
VPYALGMASRDALLKFGYVVEWHEYAMQHSVCDAELRDTEAWFKKRIGNSGV